MCSSESSQWHCRYRELSTPRRSQIFEIESGHRARGFVKDPEQGFRFQNLREEWWRKESLEMAPPGDDRCNGSTGPGRAKSCVGQRIHGDHGSIPNTFTPTSFPILPIQIFCSNKNTKQLGMNIVLSKCFSRVARKICGGPEADRFSAQKPGGIRPTKL